MSININTSDFTTSDNKSWLDELLVKSTDGKLKPYHQTEVQNSEISSVSSAAAGNKVVNSELEMQEAEPILPSIYVAPTDDNFYSLSHGHKPDEIAKHSFHPSDELQLQALASQLPTDDSKKFSLEKIIERLLEKQQLNFDQQNKERFANILYDFFRNRKNAPVAREYLSALQNGPAVLAPTAIDTILSIARDMKAKIDQSGGLVVRGEQNTGQATASKAVASLDKVLLNLASLQTQAKNQQAKVQLDSIKQNITPLNKTEETKKSEKTIDLKINQPQNIESTSNPVKNDFPVRPVVFSDLPKVNRPNSAARPKLADIYSKTTTPPPSKILSGPVDELANINLANFRRLGVSAKERTQRIYEKIQVLEQDSISKKAAGIAAWRKSPVYQAYVNLGMSGLNSGKQLEHLTQENQAQGVDNILSHEEFMAISDLNQLLRF